MNGPMEHRQPMPPETSPARVLIVDRDADVAGVVQAILTDEGYLASAITDQSHDAITRAVGRLEPDCLLLDGESSTEYGASWTEAALLAVRSRAIPVVMFSAHAPELREATDGTSDRAVAAGFAAILPKPFDIDQLLDAVAGATNRSVAFDRSHAADGQRNVQLVHDLRARGATDIRTSNRREWATFSPPATSDIVQLYWWDALGAYVVGRYQQASATLEPVGQFTELAAALDAVLAPVS
jgi:CheY-like chemotaxis protein